MSIRDDSDLARPKCPRCLSIDSIERLPQRHVMSWWCGACNLACKGTSAEHEAESRQRAEADAELAERQRRQVANARGELA